MFACFERIEIATDGAVINLVRGGEGPPLLLIHGYPQTHVMWHKLAPRLANQFTIIAPDLRGYGDSTKPPGGPDHAAYSKRAMAQDMASVMETLGYPQFMVAGHDRGARVVHRLCLDHPERVVRAAVLDIAPTYTMFITADRAFGHAYYHWFFLSQPFDLPERLIGADPAYWVRRKLAQWGRDESAFTPEALAEYIRCFADPTTIHASCEDYRAAAGIDLVHDEADLERKITCPLLVLWGGKGFVAKQYDVLATWCERAHDVRGHALPCGHFLPEEDPEGTYLALQDFFAAQ
ncbi:MAG: alpha/beta fold hydrolase [Oscillochloridaceae bacterium umkhey_bin13]